MVALKVLRKKNKCVRLCVCVCVCVFFLIFISSIFEIGAVIEACN